MSHAIGKLLKVWTKCAVLIAAFGPAVIEHYVVVASVPQANVDQLLRCADQKLLVDITAKCVPVVLSTVSMDLAALEKAICTHPI